MATHVATVADGTGTLTLPAVQDNDILVGYIQKSAGSDPALAGTLAGVTSLSVEITQPGSEYFYKSVLASGDEAKDITWGGSARRGVISIYRLAEGETLDAVVGLRHNSSAGTSWTIAAGVVVDEGDIMWIGQGASSDVNMTVEDADLAVRYSPLTYGAGNRGIGAYDFVVPAGTTSTPALTNTGAESENWKVAQIHIQTTAPSGSTPVRVNAQSLTGIGPLAF